MCAGTETLDAQLRCANTDQLERFEDLAPHFGEMLELARASQRPGLVARAWEERNAAYEDALLPVPPLHFIRHPSVLGPMFVDEALASHELPPLVAAYGAEQACRLLAEDPIGGPPLLRGPSRCVTSSNSIHHLHHLWRFHEETGADVAAARHVVEWGGGYGNLAKLARRLHPGGLTYVIVDTPLLCAVQWLYLSSVLGPDEVVLLDPVEGVQPGRINLVPVGLVAEIDLQADLFISTWALSESPVALQEHVFERRWFGAGHLLMGMHEGVALASWAADGGARVVPIGAWMPGQTYVLR